MCHGCFREYWPNGVSPDAALDLVASVAHMIRRYYETNPAGGRFHVQLDDDNVDIDLTPYLTADWVMEWHGEPTDDERELAAAFDFLSEPLRELAVALAHGYATTPDGDLLALP